METDNQGWMLLFGAGLSIVVTSPELNVLGNVDRICVVVPPVPRRGKAPDNISRGWEL